jgi:hypothetical protein
MSHGNGSSSSSKYSNAISSDSSKDNTWGFEAAKSEDSSDLWHDGASSSDSSSRSFVVGKGLFAKQQDRSSSSSSSSSRGLAGSRVASGFPAGLDARPFPASAFRITVKSLLFGFPNAAIEAAYGCYKTSEMRMPCLVLGLISHGVVACMCTVRLLLLLVQGSNALPNSSTMHVLPNSSTMRVLPSSSTMHVLPNSSSLELHMAALRLLYPAVYTAVHLLVWTAASSHQWRQQPRWLHMICQNSGAVLSAGMLIPTVLLAGNALTGGTWAAACAANNAAFLSSPWLFCLYRHVIEPLQFRAGLQTVLVSVAVQLLLFDALYTRPQLLGLGPNCTAALLCVMHLGVAAWLEYSMRSSFVRRAMRGRIG